MMKLKMVAYVVLMMFAIAMPAVADHYLWKNASGENNSWWTVDNWTVGGSVPATVPDTDDTVWIDGNSEPFPSDGPIVNQGIARSRAINIGQSNTIHTAKMYLAEGGIIGTVTMNLGDRDTATGIFIVSGGSASVTDRINLGLSSGTGMLQISGGSITTPYVVYGGDSSCFVELSGGTLNITDNLVMSTSYYMDVTGDGTLVLPSSRETAIQSLIDSGNIYCSEGNDLQIVLDGGNIEVSMVPEPMTIMLLGSGAVMAMIQRRKR